MSMRTILHSDANCFYASVEMLLNPSLRGKAVAVCGSEDDRHGIVLAKSEKAKRAGVKTGQANWEARQACPGLICVPPHYEQYNKFSILLRNIYLRYTDLVEPYGMDECWLDVTGNDKIHGTGLQIAEDIRQTVKEELGITVSIGVSFTKILAKLGSDMKKPDAITVLDYRNWKECVWPLPVSDLFFVGRATAKKLFSLGIKTIGDLAGPCLFAVLMGISRVFYGKMSEKLDLTKTMLGCGALCILCYLLASLSPLPVLGLMGCALCGISVGIMWPGTLSISAQKCPKGGTVMFALLALAGDLGGSIGPSLVGSVSSMADGNLKTGLLVATLFPALLIAGLVVLKKWVKTTK